VIHPQLRSDQLVATTQYIDEISHIRKLSSDIHRSRAWICMSCEKKTLAAFLEHVFDHYRDIIETLYEPHAFLRDETCAHGMIANLMGLNAIDMPLFTFYYRNYKIPNFSNESPSFIMNGASSITDSTLINDPHLSSSSSPTKSLIIH
jgi:hypothetical protein